MVNVFNLVSVYSLCLSTHLYIVSTTFYQQKYNSWLLRFEYLILKSKGICNWYQILWVLMYPAIYSVKLKTKKICSVCHVLHHNYFPNNLATRYEALGSFAFLIVREIKIPSREQLVCVSYDELNEFKKFDILNVF